MAYVASLFGTQTQEQRLAIFNAALEYAGGDFAERLKVHETEEVSSSWFTGFYDKETESPDETNFVFGYLYGYNANGGIAAKAHDGEGYFISPCSYYDTKFIIVATKYGIGLLRCENLSAFRCGVITQDNYGEFVIVHSGDAGRASQLINPTVIARNESYTNAIEYPASTSEAFGCTSLSYIPVPTYDGTPHYLPNMAYANATQYKVNGPVLMGQKIWYCFGGAFYLYEGEKQSA